MENSDHQPDAAEIHPTFAQDTGDTYSATTMDVPRIDVSIEQTIDFDGEGVKSPSGDSSIQKRKEALAAIQEVLGDIDRCKREVFQSLKGRKAKRRTAPQTMLSPDERTQRRTEMEEQQRQSPVFVTKLGIIDAVTAKVARDKEIISGIHPQTLEIFGRLLGFGGAAGLIVSVEKRAVQAADRRVFPNTEFHVVQHEVDKAVAETWLGVVEQVRSSCGKVLNRQKQE